jgi:hypothetical protein
MAGGLVCKFDKNDTKLLDVGVWIRDTKFNWYKDF